MDKVRYYINGRELAARYCRTVVDESREKKAGF